LKPIFSSFYRFQNAHNISNTLFLYGKKMLIPEIGKKEFAKRKIFQHLKQVTKDLILMARLPNDSFTQKQKLKQSSLGLV